eukprot:TRINITY_DN331_c0_g2_i1.p1 TRINITY_DN331_c0_g2~~TRINITY_DN331_c0_g2_i1.p1  ORF type:complete len:213 (-),score=37.42 TRINITY_DN331_c0_g2_i1:195-833(-)
MSRGITFKVVLLGEGSVGKTSLVTQYIHKTFNERHVTTIQASFLSKKLNVQGKSVTLNIWDTAGQERFHALGPIYYRESHGALLVYDITDNNSFIKVKNWVKELRRMLGKEVVIAIIGNKIDLERSRAVNKTVVEKYVQQVGAKHYHTSAKLNKGLEELFLDLTKRMIALHHPPQGDVTINPEEAKDTFRADDDLMKQFEATQGKSGGTCCG